MQLLQVPGWHHRLRQGCPMRALMCASAQSHRGGRPLPGRPRRRDLRRRRRPSVRTWHLARGLHRHQPLPCQVRVRFLAHHWLIHSFSTSYFSQGNTTQGIHKYPCMSTARSNVCASSAFCAAAGLLPLVNDTLSSLQQHAGSVTTNWPHLAELKQPNYVTVVKNRVNFGQRFCGVACTGTPVPPAFVPRVASLGAGKGGGDRQATPAPQKPRPQPASAQAKGDCIARLVSSSFLQHQCAICGQVSNYWTV